MAEQLVLFGIVVGVALLLTEVGVRTDGPGSTRRLPIASAELVPVHDSRIVIRGAA